MDGCVEAANGTVEIETVGCRDGDDKQNQTRDYPHGYNGVYRAGIHGVDLCPRHGGDNIPFRRFKPAECKDDVRFKQITGTQAAHLLHQRRRQGRFTQMRVVCVRQNTALRIRKEHFVMVGAACGKYLMKLRNAHIGKKHTAQLVVIRLAFQRHSTGNNGGGLGYARLTRCVPCQNTPPF